MNNKYNPTKPSEKAKTLIGTIWSSVKKMRMHKRFFHPDVQYRLNGSIIAPKEPSRRDLHRMEVAERCK